MVRVSHRLTAGISAAMAVCCVMLSAGCFRASDAPLGLPPVPVSADNPVTPAKVDLGRKIFLDRRLSPDAMACADCHVPSHGFTVNGHRTCMGADGRKQRRNSPTLLNVAFYERLYHDGRETTLENQVWGPLLSTDEMNIPSADYVVARIRGLSDYDGLFETAFAGKAPDAGTIGQALAAFERTLVSGNSRFDRWRYGKSAEALNAMERRGFELFMGKAGCAQCHTVGQRFALFTDQSFHNTGVGWARSMARGGEIDGTPSSSEAGSKPGTGPAPTSVQQPLESDEGRFEVTRDAEDRWAYRTPTLRNIAVTAPYMHDGSLATLRDVVRFYDQGGIDNPGKDFRVRPLGLTEWEKSALAAFLETLTGDNVALLDLIAQAPVAEGASRPD